MLVPNEKILNPGDILVESLTIESAGGATLDVKGQYVSINIYEDMFANGLSGFLVLVDSLNLLRYLQVTGRETLRVTFITPGETATMDDYLDMEFMIYKVTTDLKLSGDGKKLVRLEFVSRPVYENTKKRLSRSFANMSYSSMVKTIMQDNFGIDVNACPTLGKKNIIIPNWNPMYAISWLGKRSAAEYSPEMCDYVFYQDLDGTYQFVPISLLKAKAPVVKYHHTPTARNQETGGVFMKKEFYNILSYSVNSRGDKMREVAAGVYSNNALAIDILGKRTNMEIYSYFNQRKRIPTISDNPLIPILDDDLSLEIGSYQKLYPKHSFRYDGVEDNDELELISTRRQSQVNVFRTHNLTIVVNGDSRRRVGEIVSIDIPSVENPKNKDDWFDPLLSGKYMITSILHEIGDGSYNLKMEVMKDGYDEKLASQQSFATDGGI